MPRRINWEKMNADLSRLLLEGKLVKDLYLINPNIEYTRGDKPPRIYVRQPIPSFAHVSFDAVADCEIATAHEEREKNAEQIKEVMKLHGLEVVKGVRDTRGENVMITTAYQLPHENYVI